MRMQSNLARRSVALLVCLVLLTATGLAVNLHTSSGYRTAESTGPADETNYYLPDPTPEQPCPVATVTFTSHHQSGWMSPSTHETEWVRLDMSCSNNGGGIVAPTKWAPGDNSSVDTEVPSLETEYDYGPGDYQAQSGTGLSAVAWVDDEEDAYSITIVQPPATSASDATPNDFHVIGYWLPCF
jgi:hypothetical protein